LVIQNPGCHTLDVGLCRCFRMFHEMSGFLDNRRHWFLFFRHNALPCKKAKLTDSVEGLKLSTLDYPELTPPIRRSLSRVRRGDRQGSVQKLANRPGVIDQPKGSAGVARIVSW
jgi:hypothetical protein